MLFHLQTNQTKTPVLGRAGIVSVLQLNLSRITAYVVNSHALPTVPVYKQKKNCLITIIVLKASGRDCTNNNELLHKIGVLQR